MVNVSSLAVDFPMPYMSGYNVVKAGLAAFSESLMMEVAGTGVVVIDFRPGDYRTNFNQTMQERSASDISPSTPQTDRLRRSLAVIDANLQAAPPPGARRATCAGLFYATAAARSVRDVLPGAARAAAGAPDSAWPAPCCNGPVFRMFLTCHAFAYWY